MATASFADLPSHGPGLKAAATDRQWGILAKDAIATIHCEPTACEECKPHDGETMRLPEAESLIPIHPNCRCAWTWDWRPELHALSVTSHHQRASESATPAIMHDTLTKTTTTADATVVTKTPTDGGDGSDGNDDTEYLRVPISSTETDRDGDKFSSEGLKDLRDQIRATPRPVFENHGIGDGGLFGIRYDWKGIIGSQDDAEIETTDGTKTLYSYIRPNTDAEGGDLLRSYVKNGMPVGLSIGFRPLDYETDEQNDEKTFHSTDLLETSAVGIQSNQESVAGRDAGTVEALAKQAAAVDADLDEDTLAKALVSELFARPPGVTTATDDGAATHTRGYDHDHDHDHDAATTNGTTTDMTDDTTTDDPDESTEYATKADVERLEAKIDSLTDGDGGDDDGGGEKDATDGTDDELKEVLGRLADSLDDADAEDPGTANKAPVSSGGGDDETDGAGDEDTATKDATDEEPAGSEVVM